MTMRSATWMDIFSSKGETLKQLEEKKHEKYKLFLDVQRKKMEFDREMLREKMELEREMMELEKHDNWMKMELAMAKINDAVVLEKEKVSLARFTEESRIVYQR